jgi:hypothetical protein
VTDFLPAPRSILSALDFLASEPSTVVIDISCSFMIVRLRQAKMHNTAASTVLQHCNKLLWQIRITVALDRSESSDLDRTAERRSNSYYCSYSTKFRGSCSLLLSSSVFSELRCKYQERKHLSVVQFLLQVITPPSDESLEIL